MTTMKPSLLLRQTLFFALTLSCIPSTAQQPALSHGAEYRLPKKHTDLGLTGNSTDGYVQVSHDYGNALSFQKFDPQMHVTGERSVSLEQLPKGYTSEAFLRLGGRYYWFYSTYHKDSDKEQLFVREYQIKSNTLQGNARELISCRKIAGNGLSDEENRKWSFYTSGGNSGLLIRYRREPEEKKDSRNKDVMGFLALDSTLDKLWSREIRMPYTEMKMEEVDYRADRSGNLYVLAKVYNSDKVNFHTDYHHELLKWEKDREEAVVISMQPGKHYVGDARLAENGQGTIMVIGYYATRKDSGADGVFVYRLDPGGRGLVPVHKGLYEFPAEMLRKYLSPNAQRYIDKRESLGLAEARKLTIVSVNAASDGTISISGEARSETIIMRPAAGNPSSGNYSSNKVSFEEVIAMQVKPDGTVGWLYKVPKNQTGSDGIGNMSFRQFGHEGGQYLLYIDNSRNLDLRENQDPAGHLDGAGGVLTLVKIDASGQIHKMPVFKEHKDKMLYYVDAISAGDRQLVVRCRDGWRKGAFSTFLVTLP